MSEFKEEAEAVKELARLGQDVVKNLPELERIGKALLGPIGGGWGFLADLMERARSYVIWRIDNRLEIYRLANQKMADANIKLDATTPVPERIAYAYEEGLEHEDEPTLQKLWANLLVNVTRSDGRVQPQKAFKDALSGMEADDAVLFQFIAAFPGLKNFGTKVAKRRNQSSVIIFDLETTTKDTGVPLVQRFIDHFHEAIGAHDDKGALVSIESVESAAEPGSQILFQPLGKRIVFLWESQRVRLAFDRLRNLGLISQKHVVPDLEKGVNWPFSTKDQAVSLDGFRQVLKALRTHEYDMITEFGRELFRAIRDPVASPVQPS